MEIGKKIKELRMLQNLTQEELANRCELTKGFISQVERDIASPSITSFIDILDALGISPSEFFENKNEKITFSDEEFIEYINQEHNIIINWTVPNSQKNMMEPTILELGSKGYTKTISPFDGEEYGYILEGEIELVYGEETFNLKKGDSFYFEANKDHYIKNNKNKKAKLLWVSSPPNF